MSTLVITENELQHGKIRYTGKKFRSRLALLTITWLVINGCLVLLPVPGNYGFLMKTVQLVAFLFAGYQVVKLNNRLQPKHGSLLYVLLHAIILLIILVPAYIYTGNNEWLHILYASAAAFVLPALLFRQYQIIARIPEVRFEPWYLPGGSVDRKISIALNSIVLRISVRPSYFAVEHLEIEVLQPGRSTLGKAFEAAITQHSASDAIIPLALEDEQGNPFAWEFFQEATLLSGRRYLNPLASLIDNELENETRIVAKRIKL